MNNKIDCRIIQDLLPSYIDGLTSEYTNQVIEEHVEECEPCKEMLQRMQEPEKKQEKPPLLGRLFCPCLFAAEGYNGSRKSEGAEKNEKTYLLPADSGDYIQLCLRHHRLRGGPGAL